MDQRDRKENLFSSQTLASREDQVLQERTVHLVTPDLLVALGLPDRSDPTDIPVYLVPPVHLVQWEVTVKDTPERKETRVTWVFQVRAVLQATSL